MVKKIYSGCICSIYRSPKEEGMYLYVDKKNDLESVPEALLKRFGKPELAMTLLLTPEKKLARADVKRVLEMIEEKGFYLQIPPRPDEIMQELRNKNTLM
ncbi:MAG: YcgL domain-containing protein [Porticoccus sp.]|nr:YcgL domain-containing protein [Porticoccus sp.]MBQ0808506.1 YcgL domain-containing protein [Porticoccus sp.]